MTRPMPAPHELPEGWFALDWGPIYNSLGQEVPTKHLTDAECAAEYWQASYELARPLAANTFTPAPEWDRACHEAAVWHRFATNPHATLNGETND